jgi:cytochrome c oxidase subunit II
MPSRRSLGIAVVSGIVAVALGILLSYLIHWFPPQASTQARNTDRLYHVLVIASVPIFVLVVTVVLYSVWQFHMRPGEELKDGPPIHGNTRLEVLWTAFPAVLLLGLVGYSFVVLHDNEAKPAREIQIGVTGQQFAWSYQYPPSVTGGAPLNSYQLYVPKGESVYFNLHSKDVIHAFWIPAFRVQEDVVPGITTHWRATPTRLGSYPVVCNLLCGLGHSLMRSTVHVVTEAQFHAWIKSQAGGTAGGTTAAAGGAG